MDIQLGHYYQDRDGATSKVLAREQKQMLPKMSATGHLDTNPTHAVTVDCFLCRDDGGVDYYVTLSGQVCGVWKGNDGKAVYIVPNPLYPSRGDLVHESSPEEMKEIDPRRYDDDFTTVWHADPHIALSLKIRAKNPDDAFGRLPAISVIERVLRPLFTSPTIEVEDISYDFNQGEIEEEEEEDAEAPYDDRTVSHDTDRFRYE